MWALAAVALAYAGAQVFVVGVDRYFAWDEAVYYAKASPRLVDYSWVPARALGRPLLLRPVTELGASGVVVRSWMLALAAAGLFLAFAPWARVVRWPAVIGAALFAGSWLSLFYGSSVSPNLPMGLAVVGAVGCALVVTEEQPRAWAYAGCGVGFAIAATTRPT